MRYNLRAIMLRVWKLYRKGEGLSFAECLHRAWISEKAQPVNAERIEAAKAAAGIDEECNTWAGWKKAGFEVIHGSKGDNATYTASFFSASQVQPIPAAG